MLVVTDEQAEAEILEVLEGLIIIDDEVDELWQDEQTEVWLGAVVEVCDDTE